MKKFVAILAIVFAFSMVACSPSAKEIEEKRIADSIHVADSLTLVQAEQARVAESIAQVKADSVKADSVAKAQLKVKKAKK